MIIPCHPSHRSTLTKTLQSLKKASSGLDVETLVIDDVESKGLSWARNQGLSQATGDYIFFVDADDTVRPNFFRSLLKIADESNADFALSSFDYAPLKCDYNLSGNAEIRSVMLPAFFGYSFDDVRCWNRGRRLDVHREQGSVCRAVFRHDFLERFQIRFDEHLQLYEDSPFIAECAARADRVASISEVLYDYIPGENGILRSSLGTDRYWNYKFDCLKNRKNIASRVGGNAMDYFAASAVFTSLELFRSRKDWRRYIADPFVAKALCEFPLSFRHPLVATAISTLRLYSSVFNLQR